MAAFRAETHAMVRSLHAAGLAAGGADEGAPGFRDDYSEHFYVGYLRDPLGNKLAIFRAEPAEGRRGGGGRPFAAPPAAPRSHPRPRRPHPGHLPPHRAPAYHRVRGATQRERSEETLSELTAVRCISKTTTFRT